MRRFFAITWLASTACAAGWIIDFGFAGEATEWLSPKTWVAVAYGVILAAIAMVIPAALLSAVLWAIEIKKLKTQLEESAAP